MFLFSIEYSCQQADSQVKHFKFSKAITNYLFTFTFILYWNISFKYTHKIVTPSLESSENHELLFRRGIWNNNFEEMARYVKVYIFQYKFVLSLICLNCLPAPAFLCLKHVFRISTSWVQIIIKQFATQFCSTNRLAFPNQALKFDGFF